jgi:phage tail sheath protein FI
MPVAPQVSYPGVYVQEVPSGVRTINAVGTSTALFLGRIKQGVLNKPVRCFSYTDFVDNFSEDTSAGDMPRYVKLFFLNGGSDCYVMRLANGAQQASVLLQSHDTSARLRFTAKQAGETGEQIRIAVTYSGRQPEVTFNLQIFRWEKDPSGNNVQKDFEEWKGLSMDPGSPLYAVDFVTQESKLVDCTAEGSHDSSDGYGVAGRPVSYDNGVPANRVAAWQALAGKFGLSTNGSQYFTVQLDAIDYASIDTSDLNSVQAGLEDAIASQINTATSIPLGQITVNILDGPTPPAAAAPHNQSDLLKITLEDQNVFVRPAASDDMAVALMLGAEQGGLEVGAFSHLRPVPTGISLNVSGDGGDVFTSLLALQQSDVNQITLPELQSDGSLANTNESVDLETTGTAADPWYIDKDGGNNGLVEKLGLIRDTINDARSARPTSFFWQAELWGNRLAIIPTARDDNYVGSGSTGTTVNIATAIADCISTNVRYYSVGSSGTAGFQTAGNAGNDGSGPQSSDYDDAYPIIDSEVDLFNLLVLPPDRDNPELVEGLWRNASVFCQQRRAFLLMDAPSSWNNAQAATSNIASARIGLVKDYSAIYFPRLVVNENGREVRIGSSGAIAGLMARIDSARGVWKAPAGTEADLRGTVGLEQTFSDSENGILNPRAINTVRVFPNGIVIWGARTMDGDDDFASEWKYIPVRRLALMMEESLYRGLKWVVFEPNDEPLWAQIRLNAGAFMHNLFRQGAFQGQKPKDAYFVKCDSETTTQNDINLGRVNIWVGFAPLKPAEFVILYLQQMAGQVEV